MEGNTLQHAGINNTEHSSASNCPDGIVGNDGTDESSNLADGLETGPSSGTGPSDGVGYYFENGEYLISQNVNRIYTTTDSLGFSKHYGSYDNTKELASFKSFGLSVILFLFSIYLFFAATKIYHQYFDKKLKEKILNYLFYFGSILIIVCWIVLVLSIKGIPFEFWHYELMFFPIQFVLGIILSSLLLLGVGVFRFSIIAFIPSPIESETARKDIKFSIIGFVFGILSVAANLWTIWSAFK